MIQFINVSKAYKEHNVIENINLEINKGELVVLIGPSGCGKTTILKMINRLIEPSDGQIKINGTDIEAQDPIELRRNIGYVIQQTGLFIHMTVRENIEIIPRLAKMPVSEIVDRTVKLMETVGLPEEFLDRYPQSFKRRTAAACRRCPRFCHEPRYYFNGRAVFRAGPSYPQPIAGRTRKFAVKTA